MTPPAPQAFRLKIPCADERDFRQHFAQKYVTAGIFVPSKAPKPVGTRVRLKLEIRTGEVLVSGDAMVTSRTPEGAGRPGMTMRITALHPESIQFELSPAAFAAANANASPAVTPSSGGTALDHLFDAEEEHAPAAPSGPDDSLEFSEVESTPQPAPTPRPAPTIARSAAPIAQPEAEPAPVEAEPAPFADAAPAPKRAAEPRRIAIWIAAGVVIVAAIATVAVVSTIRIARPQPQGGAEARVVAELRIADARLLDGRLADAGGDSALDHLLLAKAAGPNDARVASRLRLLGDKFEELGNRALSRGNLREAEVHFAAALRTDPGREGARAKLAEIAAAAPDGVAPAR